MSKGIETLSCMVSVPRTPTTQGFGIEGHQILRSVSCSLAGEVTSPRIHEQMLSVDDEVLQVDTCARS